MINNIELFAGAGGLADGLEQSGNVHLLASVEWLKPQVRTLRKRLEKKYNIQDASERVLNFDIQRTEELINGWTNDTEFETSVGLDKLIGGKSVDMISGGPPCQAYSLAGRIRDKNGMKDDYRNFLFESYIRLVDYYKPKIILFENVEGMLSAIPTGENITDLIRNGFDSIGYEIIDDLRKYALIDLSNYGVPQKRKRVIILGVRRDSKDTDYQKILRSFYTELLPSRMTKVKTVRDAISDLPPIYPLKEQIGRNAYDNSNAVNGHSSRFHSLRDQKIFNLLAQDIVDGTKKYTSAEALKQLYFETTGKNSNVHKYHVLRWDEPSNTIPAHLKKDGLRHIHPDPNQKRSITVREAARLQTFDDDFEFNESQLANFEMIGNAVPPLFAKVIGDLLPQFLDQIKLEEME
ncbi:DNA cytosine methyltransferase [Streptococcus suis]|uniref:DNA cytosine methyltransferase n=1 Tax=Streptococcus suis TaxID=1307 RepID=UPI0005CDCBEE|nr:DNA cytosine methyltransferase [Streptococcus suis]NQG99625.1 DNA cytosine methyltransferase [Streptococcus suis]CYV39397.1 site-specific DNA methylase [Streptococcus suis]HEM3968561.1 DNA cytosine methyltransferase [Streptococcus suis]HEM3980774.1 DNA cytosine methyltransferase [Streptococcus suis]